MATTEKIMDAVRAYGVLSMRLGVDYLAETLLEQHEQFNRIRAMLAPVAPDPGLRFTKDEVAALNTVCLTLEAERMNRGCTFPVPAIATVRAMLAERGVR